MARENEVVELAGICEKCKKAYDIVDLEVMRRIAFGQRGLQMHDLMGLALAKKYYQGDPNQPYSHSVDLFGKYWYWRLGHRIRR